MTRQKTPDGENGASRMHGGRVEGHKGLSSSTYVVGELDTSRRGEDGEWIQEIRRSAIPIRTAPRCDHSDSLREMRRDVDVRLGVPFRPHCRRPSPARRNRRREGPGRDGRAAHPGRRRGRGRPPAGPARRDGNGVVARRGGSGLLAAQVRQAGCGVHSWGVRMRMHHWKISRCPKSQSSHKGRAGPPPNRDIAVQHQ